MQEAYDPKLLKLLNLSLPSLLSTSSVFEPFITLSDHNLHYSLALLGSLKELMRQLPDPPDLKSACKGKRA